MKLAVRLTALAILCSSFTIIASAASLPKTTGDADWINPWSGQQVNLTFNAIATKAAPSLTAKGSAIYTDPNVTYTMDVQFVKVSGNTAWLAGQVTSVTPADGYQGCCKVGNWIFYEVQDKAEPGAGFDLIWGEDITQSGMALATAQSHTSVDESVGASYLVQMQYTPNLGGEYTQTGMTITGGNIQVH